MQQKIDYKSSLFNRGTNESLCFTSELKMVYISCLLIAKKWPYITCFI